MSLVTKTKFKPHPNSLQGARGFGAGSGSIALVSGFYSGELGGGGGVTRASPGGAAADLTRNSVKRAEKSRSEKDPPAESRKKKTMALIFLRVYRSC